MNATIQMPIVETAPAAAPSTTRRRRAGAWTLIALLLAQPSAGIAQVLADAASAFKPKVESAANGVPLVQITAPNATGVSRNQYQRFDVETRGLILNNSQGMVQSQLGGWVDGNSNITGVPARLILNEVTSTLPSSLRGAMEVAGQKAEVVVANPNGITCDGCGFINTNRGVLTTGVPIFGAGGTLDAFRVTGGQIAIEGAGLNAANLDQLDLIARSVSVNAALWAKNLNVVAGANEVNYADLGVQTITGQGGAPTVAIDVALLGGMYANKIRLIGTEAGVGVASAGTLAAQTEDMVLSSAGRLTLSGTTTAAGALSVTAAGDMSLAGTVDGRQTVSVSGAAIAQGGTLAAGGDLTIAANSFAAVGTLAAGLGANGRIGTAGDLRIDTVGQLSARGENLAAGNLHFSGASVDLAGARSAANGDIDLRAGAGGIAHQSASTNTARTLTIVSGGAIDNTDGALLGRDVAIQASGLINRRGTVLSDGGAATMTLSGVLDNAGGWIEANGAGSTLTVSANGIDNSGGRIANSGSGLTSLDAGSGALANDNAGSVAGMGLISGGGELSIAAGSIANTQGGSLIAGGSASVTATGAISNTGGWIETDGTGATLAISGAGIDNRDGRIANLGSGLTRLDAGSGALTNGNAGGVAGMGLISGAGDLTLVAGSLGNTQGGWIEASGTSGVLSISSDGLDNSGGRIANRGSGLTSVAAGSGTLTNSNAGNVVGMGFIGGAGDVSLTAGSIANTQGGWIDASGAGSTLAVRADGIDNRGGRVINAGSGATTLDAQSGVFRNDNAASAASMGLVSTAGDLSIAAASIVNTQGATVVAGGDATLTASAGPLDNQGGWIEAAGAGSRLTISAIGIDNSDGRIANRGSGLTRVDAGSGPLTIANAGNIVGMGVISGAGDLALTAGSISNTQGAAIIADGSVDLTATSGALGNTGGWIEANGAGSALAIRASGIDNRGGRITNSGSGLTRLDAGSGALTNGNAGNVAGMGLISAGGDLALAAGSIANMQGASLIAGGSATLAAAGAVDNTGGWIETDGTGATLAISGAGIDNRDGRIVNLGSGLTSLDAGSGALTNGNAGNVAGMGLISGAGDLALVAGSLGNTQGGWIEASGTSGVLSISAGGIDNRGGRIINAGSGATTLDAQSGVFTNANAGNAAGMGLVSAAGDLSIVAASIANTQGGTVVAGGDATLTASSGAIDNQGGWIEAAGAGSRLTISAVGIDNSDGRIANRGSGLTTVDAGSGALINRNAGNVVGMGVISGAGDLAVTAGSIINTQGAAIVAGGDIDLAATTGTLDNTGGWIEADGAGSTLAIRADGIDNSGGRIANSGSGLTSLDAGSGATLTNNNAGNVAGMGLISAGGDLSITAGSIANIQGASLVAGGGATLAAAGAVDNTGGWIETDGTGATLAISGAGIDNRDGRIANLGSGLTRLDAGNSALTNGNAGGVAGMGLISGAGDLTLVAGSLGNTQGGWIEASGTSGVLSISTGGIDNRGGRIANRGNGLTSVAAGSGTLTNSNSGNVTGMGFIGGAGDVSLTAGRIANTQGGSIVAVDDATLTATSGTIDNTGGSITAGGQLALATAQTFSHRAGDSLRGDAGIRIDSAADLGIDSGATLDSPGAIDLAAAAALNNQGTIVSSVGTILDAGTLTNSGTITIGGDLAATVAGSASNSGAMSSQGALTLTANALTNSAAASLAAGTDLTIATANDLTNQGALSGNNVTLTAANLDNQGALAAMADLTVKVAGQLSNRSNRLIYAGRDQFLYANALVNEEDGAIWAGRDITIQKNAAGDRALAVTNQIGLVEAQGTLTVRADTLTNQGTTPVISTRSISDAIPYPVSACPGGWPINGGCVDSGAIDAYGYAIYNSSWGFRIATPGDVNAYFDRNPVAPYVVGGTNLKLLPTTPSGDAHERESGWEAWASGTEQYIAPGSVIKTGRLLAGQDFSFSGGDLLNQVGQISANRNITLTGNSLVNQGQALQRVVTYSAQLFTYSAGRHLAGTPVYSTTPVDNIGAVPSSITAGGSLSGNLTSGLVNDPSALPALNAQSAQNNVATAAVLPVAPITGLQNAAGAGSAGASLAFATIDTTAAPAAGLQNAAGAGTPGASQAAASITSTAGATPAAPATDLQRVGGVSAAPASLAGGVRLIGGALDTHAVAIPTGSTSLFTVAPPNASYLIEANPLFADRNRFLGSDYFLQRLNLDPQATTKRLGDGFYEQALIRDQIFALTGRRFLGDERDATVQYRALMEAGVSAGAAFHFPVGIDLGPAQIAQLTSDIVWLVEREVAGQKVLVPQVYLGRLHASDLQLDGALIAANDIDLVAPDLRNAGRISAQRSLSLAATDLGNRGIIETTAAAGLTRIDAARDLINEGGTIAGGKVIATAGRDLLNRAARITRTTPGVVDSEVGAAGRILAADSAYLGAARDLKFAGGQLASGGDSALAAGRDLTLGTALKETRVAMTFAGGHANFSREVHGASTLKAGGKLQMTAGQDLTITGSAVSAQKTLVAAAGGTLTVGAAKDREQGDVRVAAGKGGSSGRYDQETVKGSTLSAGGDLTLIAGANGQADLRVEASSVTSTSGAIALAASRDVAIGSVDERKYRESETWGKSSGFLSSRSHQDQNLSDTVTPVGSLISGESVSIAAGRDLAVRGSAIVGTGDVRLDATRNVAIEATQASALERRSSEDKQSGLFSSGGASVTLGKRELSQRQSDATTTSVASTVGSNDGNVAISTGKAYTQSGSAVLAPQGDIAITAERVDIVAATDTARHEDETRTRQSGLTLSVSNPVLSAAESARQMAQAARETKDPRLKALAAATAAMAVKNAVDAVKADPGSAGGVNLSLTLGSSRSESSSQQTSSNARSSSVLAGGDVAIRAEGAGVASSLNVTGADLAAGRDMLLKSEGDLQLQAARSDSQASGQSSGSGAAIGVSVGIGTNGVGVSLTASANRSKSQENGTDTIWTNTHVTAGNTLTLQSGADTALAGAVASGKEVRVEVGGDLKLQSLQDSSTYKETGSSAGIGVSVPIWGTGNLASPTGFNASANLGGTRIASDYQSVREQTAIQAGRGGFDVNVRGNTNLAGAVIASEGAADKNRLVTGSLTTSDIENRAKYEGQSFNVGVGYGNVGKDQTGNASADQPVPGSRLPATGGLSATPPVALSASGEAQGVSRSAVAPATVLITDEQKQAALSGQDAKTTVASLNRDTANANASVAPIFDKQEIETGFAIAGALVNETGTFLANRARESDTKKKEAEDKERQAGSPTTSDEQRQVLKREAEALRQEGKQIADDWGPGGRYRQVLTALTAAAGANVAGSSAQFVQGAVANYLQSLGAEQIKAMAPALGGEGSAAHTALHALLACAGAAASNQSCGAGALGAASGVVINALLGYLPENATAEAKEARKNLVATLVVGVAGTAGMNAATATTAATIETENNSVRKQEVQLTVVACKNNRACQEQQLKEFDARGKRSLGDCQVSGYCERLVSQYQEGIKTLIANSRQNGGALDDDLVKAQVIQNIADIASALQNQTYFDSTTTARQKQAVNFILDLIPIVGDVKGFAEAQSGLDYAIVAIGALGPVGDASKALVKEAKTLIEVGDKVKAAEKIEAAKVATAEIQAAVRADGLPVVKVPAGSKGEWNAAINGELKPKTAYELGNGHTYVTDASGRVKSVEGELDLAKEDRNGYQQCATGKCGSPGDEGGHLIASSLGGAGDRINIVPQAQTLNRGDWRAMENELRNALKEGKEVSVKIDVAYPAGNGARPSSFLVQATINGKIKEFPFRQ